MSKHAASESAAGNFKCEESREIRGQYAYSSGSDDDEFDDAYPAKVLKTKGISYLITAPPNLGSHTKFRMYAPLYVTCDRR